MTIFSYALLSLVFIVSVVFIYIITSSVVTYINQLTMTSHVKQKLYENSIVRSTIVSPADMLNNSDKLLDIIDSLIENEVELSMYKVASLRTKYDIKYLDRDTTTISENVASAIKKEFLNDNKLMINSSYIYSYIARNTSLALISAINNYNATMNDNGM